ncbi:MAG: hypothetical protein JSS32_08335 [Verrucomicrobia bacterium]|nr:hypothetical protein [Verrucomicrobiota bacterium]
MSAPLSASVLMLPREIPSYLRTARSLRFPETGARENFIQKIVRIVKEYFTLIGELLGGPWPGKDMFEKNIAKLETDFEKIRGELGKSDKPICAYFVAPYDEEGNGAILGDRVYYYYHYKIKNFQKDFEIAPFLAHSAEDMFKHLRELKEAYPGKEIQVVNYTSHGDPSTVLMPVSPGDETAYGTNTIKPNEFKDCAEDATILVDACSTGRGKNSFAEAWARNNPGKTVLAPGKSLFFSKPVISRASGKAKIDYLVHGFAIFNAPTARKFHYAKV